MAKPKVIYQENYKKGASISTIALINTIKANIKITDAEIINKGQFDNGDEFITVKFITNQQ